MLFAADALLPARYQMAFSLGWHIVIACFGVAFPAMILAAHLKGLRGDDAALELARRWSKTAGLLFALGAVSGTILSFEMGLLWPGLMGTYGDVIGLPFAMEGLSFFTEAIFIGVYLYGWDRLAPRVHVWTLLPVVAAGITGSFSVLAANGWMNDPTGFDVDAAGNVTNVEPWAAFFNSAVWHEWPHMFLAAYMVVGFIVAGVYANGLRAGRRDRLHHLGVVLPLTFATVAAIAQPVVGHFAGSRLDTDQPSKLAAMELATDTESGAPLVIGGLLIDGEVRYGIEIPKLGSLFAGGSLDAEIVGLNDVPEGDEIPVNVVHLSFQTMVGLGTALALLGLGFWVYRLRGRDPTERRWFTLAVIGAGPAAVMALLAGWVTTEVGRQPWIAYRVMRVDEAVTDAGWIWWSFAVIVAVYASMTVFGTMLLRAMSRRWRTGDPGPRAPYGPEDGPEDGPENIPADGPTDGSDDQHGARA